MAGGTTVRKTLRWMVVLTLLTILAGGGYAYWMFARTDELLLSMILKKQQEFAPDWDMTVDRAHFDWNRRIRIYNVTIKVRGRKEVVLSLPEVVVTIDHEKFKRDQQIVIDKIRLIRPEADFVRTGEGIWNWEDLLRLPRSDRSLPEWSMEQGTIYVRLDQADGSTPGRLRMEKVDVQLIPSGKRQYTFRGEADVNHAGRLAMAGEVSVDSRQWSIDGTMKNLVADGALLNLAAGTSPELRTQLAELDDTLQQAHARLTGLPQPARWTERSASRTASRGEEVPPHVPATGPATPPPLAIGQLPVSVPDFGVKCTLDMHFHVEQASPRDELDFRMLVHLQQGQIANPVLPFPLRELSGEVYWDNRQILLRELTAKNGSTRLRLDGRMEQRPDATSARLEVRLSELMLDERLRSRLPPEWRTQYDLIQPQGPVDLDVTLGSGNGRDWRVDNLLLTARECTLTNARFPYPVTRVTGTVSQVRDDWVVHLQGVAARQPVAISGWIRQPGPGAEVSIDVRARQFPLDERFLQAAPPELRELVQELNLSGWADADLHLHRPFGGDRFSLEVDARLFECELEPSYFPYRLSEVRGRIRHHSAEGRWDFEDFQGRHGATTVRAAGRYSHPDPNIAGVLRMGFAVEKLPLDETLRGALSPQLKATWDQFAPTGQVDVRADIHWHDGQLAIALPEVFVREGTMVLQSLPFPLGRIEAKLSYRDDVVDVLAFSGWHEETHVRAEGRAVVPALGVWRVRLDKLYVDDLSADRQFRRALPVDLRTAVEELDPQGPLSLSGMLELAGTHDPRVPVTAAWDVAFVFNGNHLRAGLEFEDLYGQVDFKGTWDGKQVDSVGHVNLNSLEVWGYQFTEAQGPFELVGQEVVFGRPIQTNPNDGPVPDTPQLTARAFGGRLLVDGNAQLEDRTSWRTRALLQDADLDQYARRYMPGIQSLRGVINGWIVVANRGANLERMTGEGQLQISPAALYELPVIAQVFSAMTFTPPQKSAFQYAFVDFGVANGEFRFNEIDLVGDAITLRGQGTARFDGRLDIDFYSMLPRAQLARLRLPLPVVSTLVDGALDQVTKGWVRVEVRGRTNRPEARMIAVPVVDDALRGFLDAFNGRPNESNPLRKITLPRLGSRRVSP